MSVKLLSKKENILFKRDECVVEISYPKLATPNKKAIIEDCAKLLKTEPGLVSLRKAEAVFGKNISKATVFVYKDKETLAKYEPLHIVERVNPKKKEGEAPAAAAPTPEVKK
jgi:ribosomal protein S24E